LLNIESQILDISEIEALALKFSNNLKAGDVLFLKGELGTGKTTFSRFIINNLHDQKNILKPDLINSPTFPILLTYNLNSYEIHHYDFYRIKSIKEIEELDFFENFKKSISIIEWPELLIELPFKEKYYSINLGLFSETKRKINIKYID
tara:strand:+ start:1150 stop:1596 length:447 start_codon:yes stop_codon:yes gene_type:complete